ncbi:type IV pilus modification protein PilV [Aestuariirhabdus litorea]|uniref:Type IV pilus modification protein PilV n=1 Tax=Aestuariirhabdus litorea TaxID=2528527 RepID=A0A3P3VHT2_9GAMM|nr:type IV pilus modification protein PilV [Aestuariirhabdus litorea]RRJ82285.1 type IV pilus modification protein PilV [Aestuariirhabdus litorea]RWW92451.1 type IV pilus modification protein PilV [Endozoicomonadaceae bacterium GTF-13]
MLSSFPRKQAGVGLIEILVTLLILAVGFLGMAALQANALRLGHSAYVRTQASVLAYDIIDRIRANPTVAQGGGYDIAIGDSGSDVDTCEAAACNTATLATYDKQQWLFLLQSQLPKGDGTVSVAGGRVTVTVQWDESRGQAAQTLATETVEALL